MRGDCMPTKESSGCSLESEQEPDRIVVIGDTTWACEKINAMWGALGQQIADAIPDMVIGGDPQKAILWATCAEACFWKATGESESHDVKDVLPQQS